MNILLVASEGVPFAKTGGLADVIGSLPLELRKQGVDARVVMPKYGTIPFQLRSKMKLRKRLTVSLGWRFQYCGILEAEHAGIPFYFVDNEYYFKRDKLYGYNDDAERFAFFPGLPWKAYPACTFNPRSSTLMTGRQAWSASF